MSSSALQTAKKRVETNLRNVNLPSDIEPSSGSETKNGPLLISLLQSRLNWCNSVFAKYRHDTIQQPRRTNNMRKKWPNMRFVGSCTVQLGAHIFPETSFYEAVRSEPWSQLAKEAGLEGEAIDDQEPPPGTHKDCTYTNLVMEFKENPGDRFLFPDQVIVEVTSYDTPFQLTGSFLLPLEENNDFFRDPKEKLALWGHQSSSEAIRTFASQLEKPKEEEVQKVTYQPANIRLSNVDGSLLHMVLTTHKAPEIVREKMMAKLKTLPTRSYLRYHSALDKSITELLQKALTVPEVVHGPVTAEKKRNELLNAVQLGKRPRADEETPKVKHMHVKDDGLRKCAYCSAKTTAMWRAGPGGSGTLCNGCGILWKQGKILKGAAVISKEEEKKRAREERERRQEEEEVERARQQESQSRKASSSKIGQYAAQILQQQQPIEPKPEIKPAPSLYHNPAGIPLPTLSIDFGSPFLFIHPACSVTLVESFFSIRLIKDGFPPAVMMINKIQLRNAKFDVVQENGLQREVLIMKIQPEDGPVIHHFNTDLLVPGDKSKSMTIRFLEKLDSSGAIVKRILEKWLITPPPPPAS
ncbi:hypothetical protein BJV82DRAFT_611703 [Fennellomyces sp. T-0311]|nr:hypothetical protein BJV82DRAFT_611703 [Fennellomyces sp. T-0311]